MWIALPGEADCVWGLPQISSNYVEAVVAYLEESDLMAGVCNKKSVTRLIENGLARHVTLIPLRQVYDTDEAIAFYFHQYRCKPEAQEMRTYLE